jgi:alanine racemase
MSVFGRIVQIKELRESAAVSYGGIAQVKAGAKIAVVEFGYADGIDRRLSNRGYVMICGKKAPILGRVCMDRLIADITDIDDVTTDDYALYFGRDGDTILRAGTVASLVDTISYELLCRINARLPRIWTEENHDNLLKMP